MNCPHPAICSKLWRSWGTRMTRCTPSSARRAPLTWEKPSVPPSLMSPPDRCCCTRGGKIFSPIHLLSSYLCISKIVVDVAARQVLLYLGRKGLLSNTPSVKLPVYQAVFDVTFRQVLLYQGREDLLSNTPFVKLPLYQWDCL